MPRKYITKRKAYTESQLQEMLDTVKSGETSFRDDQTRYKIDNHYYLI